MTNECLVCGDEEGETTPLLALACGRHFVCMDPESKCLAETFNKAINNEQLYPVKCCNEILLIDDFQGYIPDLIPFDLYMSFKEKEQEYATQARYRLYCGNKACGKYLHRQNYHKFNDISCAKCDCCSTYTCTYCKNRVEKHPGGCELCAVGNFECPQAILEHECVISESDKQFKDAVKENGYQECFSCGSTVELSEACNHMTCTCGCEFCYVCGKAWQGYHGCPQYGAPIYDEEGYNQDGFHRDTGRDREGYTRGSEEDEGEDDEDDEEDDEEHEGDEEEDDEEDGDEDGDPENDENQVDHQGGFDMTGIDDETRQLILSLPEDLQQDAWEQARFAAIDRGDILPPNEDGDNDAGEDPQHADNENVGAVSEHNGEEDNVNVSNEPHEPIEPTESTEPIEPTEQQSVPTSDTPLDGGEQPDMQTQSLALRPADPERENE